MHLLHTRPASGTQYASNIFLLLCWFCTKQPAYPANQTLTCGNCIPSPFLVLETLHIAFLQQTNVLLFPLDVYLCRRRLVTQAYSHTILGPYICSCFSPIIIRSSPHLLQSFMFSGCNQEVLKFLQFPMPKFHFLRGPSLDRKM